MDKIITTQHFSPNIDEIHSQQTLCVFFPDYIRINLISKQKIKLYCHINKVAVSKEYTLLKQEAYFTSNKEETHRK